MPSRSRSRRRGLAGRCACTTCPTPSAATRLAGLAVRHARLRTLDRRAAHGDRAAPSFPTKHARIGNAVGLDTPASAIALLRRAARRGLRASSDDPRRRRRADARADRRRRLRRGVPHRRAARAARRAAAASPTTRAGSTTLPERRCRRRWSSTWGPPPGEQYVDGDDLVLAGLELGNVFVAIQPPRGFGENPVAIYHDPGPRRPRTTTSPSTAGSTTFGAPTRSCTWASTARSSGCRARRWGSRAPLLAGRRARRPPALLPVRRQRPRRGHAGQAPRPRRRSSTTCAADDAGRHLRRARRSSSSCSTSTRGARRSTRPSCRPLQRADLGRCSRRPSCTATSSVDDAARRRRRSTSSSQHVDGYLCELKDAQIRGGLHVLGRRRRARRCVDLVLAIMRLPQRARAGAARRDRRAAA